MKFLENLESGQGIGKKENKQRYGLKQQGKAKDGTIVFTDESGKVKERIIFGQLL